MPSAPVIGDAIERAHAEPELVEAGHDLLDDRAPWTSGSRTIPPLPTRARPASNCGLTSRTNSASGVVSARRCGATVRNEMNETSTTQTSAAGPICVELDVAHVGALHHRDAIVGAQRPRELPAADIDRDHVRRRRAAAGSR